MAMLNNQMVNQHVSMCLLPKAAKSLRDGSNFCSSATPPASWRSSQRAPPSPGEKGVFGYLKGGYTTKNCQILIGKIDHSQI